MAEYLVKTDKPIRLDEVLHLHGIHHYEVKRLEKHGRLIDADTLLPKSGYDPMMFKHKYDGDHRTQYDTLMGYEILGIVEDAPTIVEAT